MAKVKNNAEQGQAGAAGAEATNQGEIIAVNGEGSVTGDGAGELLPPIAQPAAIFTHSVKAGPAKGFHRAGKFWTREETVISRADFSDEQWAALEAEPMLTIQQL